MKYILIISHPEDLHAKAVVEHLGRGGFSYRFIDFTQIGRGLHLSFSVRNGMLDCTIADNKNTTTLNDIQKVWDRRVYWDIGIDGLDGLERCQRSSYNGLIRSLQYVLSPVFFPNPSGERNARNKLLQLITAQKVGLNTPSTVIGNSPEHVTATLQGPLAVKPLMSSNMNLKVGSSTYMASMGTSRCFLSTINTKSGAERLRKNPEIIQEYIEKLHELRITIVGRKIFAAGYDSQSDEKAVVDGRQGDTENMKHWKEELPEGIKKKLLAYMDELELNFACIDMIVTPEKEYVFLEANTNGQWLWIEEMTGMKISKAIADMLVS